MINMRLAVTLATLLTIGSVLLVFAHQTPPPGTHESNCEQEIAAVDPQAHGGHATVARVIQVDHQQGLLHLDTARGRLLTFATPEDIKDLQEGDHLRVCVADADPAETLRPDALVN
jgi:hypothetical protein